MRQIRRDVLQRCVCRDHLAAPFLRICRRTGSRNWLRRIRFFSAGNADGAMLMERGAA